MTEYYILIPIILLIAVTMAMVGKGGGNFYVITLVLAGITMHKAASTSQSIMLATSLAAMFIFSNNKKVDWKLTLIIGPSTFIMAFFGGYLSGLLGSHTLKIIFTVILIVVSFFMLIKVKNKPSITKTGFGYWHREFNGYSYTVNLFLVLPITSIVGLVAGAVGISGGSFIIPLLVLVSMVPMGIAIGTSSAMVAATSLMGLIGHSINGNFDLAFALPLITVAIIGGIIGGKLALKNKPKNLKLIFALTNLAAGIAMLVDIFLI